jgi:hypothetical protein
VRPGRERTTHYFSGLGWPGAVSIKSAPGHVTPKNVFASGGICGSDSAFQCVRAVKCRRTIFYAGVGPVWILQKRSGTRYAEHVFCIRWNLRVM